MRIINKDDKIRNECIRLAPIFEKLYENRSKWFENIYRSEETETVNMVKEMIVKGQSGRMRLI